MADAAKKKATYDDLIAVPAHLVAEIIGGVLKTSPRPAPRHAHAASRLVTHVSRPFGDGHDGPGGWWILVEPELHLLDGEVLVPDLAGWRIEHMSELPETAYFSVAPDWIAEVLSHSTEADDRADKMPIYARAGVSHAWLVDPVLRTIEIFRLEAQAWLIVTTFKGDDKVRAEPFDAVPFDMGALWRPPSGAMR